MNFKAPRSGSAGQGAELNEDFVGAGGGEGRWWTRIMRKKGRARVPSFRPHPLAAGLFVSISCVAATKRGFFSLSRFPPSPSVYLFDFTPRRPKWPLPRVQNYFIRFCSEADSHSEPWKGPLERPGWVFSWVFRGSVSVGFSRFCSCSRCGNQCGLSRFSSLSLENEDKCEVWITLGVFLWPFNVRWMLKYQQVNSTVCLMREKNSGQDIVVGNMCWDVYVKEGLMVYGLRMSWTKGKWMSYNLNNILSIITHYVWLSGYDFINYPWSSL